MELVLHSKELKDTAKIANDLAKLINGGEVVCLTGDLGAGKTKFTQSLLKSLGVTDIVSSPTFTIAKMYNSPKGVIYHMDLYRIESEEELLEIGLQEMLDEAYLVVIEWPDVARSYFKNDIININISFDDNQNRVFKITGGIE